jgi:hypothetical protein
VTSSVASRRHREGGLTPHGVDGFKLSTDPLFQVERWFGLVADQMIRRGAYQSIHALEADIRTRIAGWSADFRRGTLGGAGPSAPITARSQMPSSGGGRTETGSRSARCATTRAAGVPMGEAA